MMRRHRIQVQCAEANLWTAWVLEVWHRQPLYWKKTPLSKVGGLAEGATCGGVESLEALVAWREPVAQADRRNRAFCRLF